MQALLPAVLAAPPLSLANLASHTQQEGLAPRRTVHLFLQGLRRTGGQYDLAPPPSDEFSARGVDGELGELTRGRKRKAVEDRDGGRDTALVLHEVDENGRDGRAVKSQQQHSSKKKKPSLVSALRPRLSSAPNSNASPVPHRKAGAVKKVHADDDGAAAGPSGSSSVLVARVERRATSPSKEDALELVEAMPTKTKVDRKGMGKAEDQDEPLRQSKTELLKKGKLRAEAEEAGEAEEVEERLRARRERRANKAFIRKDRTQTATAVGAAAASRVKKATKKRRGSSVENESPSPEKVKKKRTSAERESRLKVQELARPTAIGTQRLTLKPPKQLGGIFNKGKASARTKVGRQLPDLAFSELNFLNAPRRSPPSPSSASSSISETLPNPSDLLQSKLPRTYGTKTKLRRTSSKHFATDTAELSHEVESAARAPSPPLAEHATAVPAAKKRGRLVFSHVEIPLHRSSSSSSLARSKLAAPIRSPSRPVNKALRTVNSSSGTNDSVLSAASLARRRRASVVAEPAPPPADLPLDDLPNPSLHRHAEASVSYGGGFEEHQLQDPSRQPTPQQQTFPSALGTASLQRFIDDGLSPQREQLELVRPSTVAPMIGSGEALRAAPYPGDGFIHLRPPPQDVPPQHGAALPSLSAVDDAITSQLGLDTPFSDAVAEYDDLVAAGYTPSHNGERAPTLFSALVNHNPSFDGASLVPNDAPTFLPPSLDPSSDAAATFYDAPEDVDPAAEEEGGVIGERRAGFLRSMGGGGETNDLGNDSVFREAMKRQWPKNLC